MVSPKATTTWLPTTTVIVIPTVTLGSDPYVPFETPNPTQAAENQMKHYLNDVYYEQEGTVIAEGTNTTPVPHDTFNTSLTSYKIIEVTLPTPVTWDVLVPAPGGERLQVQTRTFDKVWRIIVTGGPFWTANNSWYVWIDNTKVGRALEGRTSVATVVFDRALLREGARIGVGFGCCPTYLPERLHINAP